MALGLILVIYLFKSNNSPNQPSKSPDNPTNVQYLPSEEEAQAKINQIKTSKGLDDQQATIEFLTQYVPHIKWWEINSLAELDEKINLVNNQTGFPPFKEVPSVDKFNSEVESNMKKKSLIFLASVVTRENDGSIDWKGLDFETYCLTILKPLMENIKFKPIFATQENYQELGRRIKEEINPLLSSLTSQFSSLSNVNDLNNLTETLLSKYFQGNIYAEAIHDELGQQLGITNHQKFTGQKTGNHSENSKWNILLYECAFKQENSPNPEPNPTDEYQLLVNDLQFVYDKFITIKERKEDEWMKQLPFTNWMCFEQDSVNGLPKVEQLQSELPSRVNDKEWIKEARNHLHTKHDWLFKNFQNKGEAIDFLKKNEHRFKYINGVWQNQK